MKVYKYPNKLNIKKSSLIMGSFEVIHNGHLKLIETAKKYRDPIVMMVIDNPTLLPKSDSKNATSLKNRLEQIANLGINYVMLVNINKNMVNTDGKEFVKKIAYICNSKRIIIGKDFKVGMNGSYKSEAILNDYENVLIEDFLKTNNIKISSSLIKELLKTGDVEEIKNISPFPFQIDLDFNHKKISNTLKQYLGIHPGIYASYCEINNINYWSLLHINMNQETKIFVPDLRIINKSFKAKIWFHKKIRTIIQTKFDNITNEDKKITAKYLLFSYDKI